MHSVTPRLSLSRRLRNVLVATTSAAALLAGSFVATSAASALDLESTLIEPTASWTYSDNNTDPAAGQADRLIWTTAGYDASSWKKAVGPFGAKNGTPNVGSAFPVTTLLNQYIDPTATSKVDVPTMHFRNSFSVTPEQLTAISGLTGTVIIDDAVQIFVNGTKVAGFYDGDVDKAPESQRNLMYAGEGNGNPRTETFTVPAAALRSGENTIAIALYQDRATSSDIYFHLASLVPTAKTGGSASITDIVLGVAGDETQRNLSWYSSTDTAQSAQVVPASTLVNGEFPANPVTVQATGGATTSNEFNRFATLTDLAPNTAYAYRVGAEGNWSNVYSFRTGAASDDFEFIFVGDPQIGASGNVQSDEAGWIDTLNVAQSSYPNAEMIFSAGDQVERAGNEEHYTSFLAPEQLRTIPLAVTNGNHDVGSKAYEQHFNIPNYDPNSGAASSGSSSGGDYWFIYKDVLFVNINSNSRDFASHNAFMEKVVAEQGPKAKWKVLGFHHSIYSVASHVNDSDIIDRRNNMPAKISELGFDLVLQGHDHSYTRSYLVKDGQLADADEVAGQRSVIAGEGEVLYMTANSASGSKYYSVKAPDAWYGSVINQERVRNYSVVSVTDASISISTLRSQANGDALPVNSVVDEVTLIRESDAASQTLQVDVPETATGEFVWKIDGTNGIVDLGTAVEKGDHFSTSGAINPIRVTDTRAGGPKWSVSAQMGDFRAGDEKFSGKYLGWSPRLLEEGAGALPGDRVVSGFEQGEGLSGSAPLGYANDNHLRGTAKLGADLDLKIPLEVKKGTYQGTLTLTALS